MSDRAASGGRLLAVRAAWVFVAILTFAVMVASVPVLFERFDSVCRGEMDTCLERSEVPEEALPTLRGAGISLDVYAAFTVGVEVFCKLVWISVGALIFVFRSGDRMALLVSFFLLTFGTATLVTNGTEALAAVNPAWWVMAKGLQVMGEVFVVLFLLTFPDGRFVPRWTPAVAVVFLGFQIPGDLFPRLYGSGPGFLDTSQQIVFVGAVFTMLGSQVYRYRYVSTPGQRRQTRWVVFGTTLAITALLSTFAVVFSYFSTNTDAYLISMLLIGSLIPIIVLLIPLSISVAIFRSGLFDVDLAINRALVYGALTLCLAGMYLGCVVSLQYAFRSITNGDSQLAIVASTLVIAAMFVPLRRRIQGFIDRRFYRRKYDARKVLEAFSGKLRNETNLEQLNLDLLAVVRETVQPTRASLWLKSADDGRRW